MVNHFRPFLRVRATTLWIAGLAIAIAGCSNDSDTIRNIQAQRQQRLQSSNIQDHLGETDRLLSRYIELDGQEARRQIIYHLNRWQKRLADQSDAPNAVSPLTSTYGKWLSDDATQERIARSTYIASDVPHLRDCYLMKQVVQWVDSPRFDDPLLKDWFAELQSAIGQEESAKLRTASRLFDWLVRNIAPERQVMTTPAPPAPKLTAGLEFRGSGYRQTDYETLIHGKGDAWQLAGVFSLLCRQAGVPAFILALPSQDGDEPTPWAIGVLVGKEIYLFEPELGIPIPLPQKASIATLAQARKDAAVLRRLTVNGFFDYPKSKRDIQQCVALINVVPEAISLRMRTLQEGLTGERRMITHVDVDRLAEEVDSVRGIAGVRLWDVPLKAEVYADDLAKAAERDVNFQGWYLFRWAMLDAKIPSARELSLGRWQHLCGKFADNVDRDEKGARALYLAQRAPEFEIKDLRIDVELQKAYGVRRQLGTTSQLYDQQIKSAQTMMRLGKRTATFWIGLLQYDDGLYDTAQSWFDKRALNEKQLSFWAPAAVYNSARTAERLGQTDKAIELYKSVNNGRPHGSRIRARILARTLPEDSKEVADSES